MQSAWQADAFDMELNADFSQRIAVHAARTDWVNSPIPGVERKMLDRIGGEVARATSIVRYAPKSKFPPHVHGGGEEFLVLNGVFQDERGDFPEGTYVRNPPQSQHTPGSESGCMIFVKLWQFDPHDRTHQSIDTNKMTFLPQADRAGVEVIALFQDAREDVRLERWTPNANVELSVPNGIELLVLGGSFSEGGEIFEQYSWLRLPARGKLIARAGAKGCRIWVKSGHLDFEQPAAAR